MVTIDEDEFPEHDLLKNLPIMDAYINEALRVCISQVMTWVPPDAARIYHFRSTPRFPSSRFVKPLTVVS